MKPIALTLMLFVTLLTYACQAGALDELTRDIRDINTCRLRSTDFSPEAIAELSTIFETNSDPKTLTLVGIAGLTNLLPRLQSLCLEEIRGYNWQFDPAQHWRINARYWAALRARARLGEDPCIYETINRFELFNSHVENRATMLKQLAYVRQPQMVQYIFKNYLMSRAIVRGGTDVIPSPVAEYAANTLSSMLADFPSQAKGESADTYILRCQDWMKNQNAFTFIR